MKSFTGLSATAFSIFSNRFGIFLFVFWGFGDFICPFAFEYQESVFGSTLNVIKVWKYSVESFKKERNRGRQKRAKLMAVVLNADGTD